MSVQWDNDNVCVCACIVRQKVSMPDNNLAPQLAHAQQFQAKDEKNEIKHKLSSVLNCWQIATKLKKKVHEFDLTLLFIHQNNSTIRV